MWPTGKVYNTHTPKIPTLCTTGGEEGGIMILALNEILPPSFLLCHLFTCDVM